MFEPQAWTGVVKSLNYTRTINTRIVRPSRNDSTTPILPAAKGPFLIKEGSLSFNISHCP